MAEVYKILGQINPVDSNEYVLYNSPSSGFGSIITNITATNLSASPQTFDINVYNSALTQSNLASTTIYPFVAIATSTPSAAYSTNGITWTLTTMTSSTTWNNTFYGNGVFVAVGQNAAAYSTNGITWSASTLNSYVWSPVAYGNGTFVTLSFGIGGQISRSTNGVSWSTPATFGFTSGALTFANGKFVAISNANSTAAVTSTDGITWTTATMPVASVWAGVTYGNSTFVAIGGGGLPSSSAATSTDGITWVLRTLPSNTTWNAITYGNGVFVAVTTGGSIAYSTDGITWSSGTGTASLTNAGYAQSIAYSNGYFVAVAGGSGGTSNVYSYSTNGATWTNSTLPSMVKWYAVTGSTVINTYVSPALNNIYKTATIQANTSEVLEPGIVLSPNNTVVIRGNSNLSFSAYGVELS